MLARTRQEVFAEQLLASTFIDVETVIGPEFLTEVGAVAVIK
jgi:hypothetical protein